MKAFIFDPLWDELITDQLVNQLEVAGLDLVVTKDIAPLLVCKSLFEGEDERILCLNPDYVGWKLSSADYRAIPNLRAILTESTNASWIDTSYADQHGIAVCNIRNFSTQAVAEWAVTMMLNVARKVPELIKGDFPLDFDKDYMKYRGIELKGKKAGIIGLGHIGSAIADRCAGLGMEVLYWSRSPKQSEYKCVTLDTLLAEADVIFPTTALTDGAKKLFSNNALQTMKPTAMLIAIEHHLFDVDLVLQMVREGRLYGFGFEAEPKSFAAYDGNVWAAPAYAWATDNTMQNAMAQWVDTMSAAARGAYPNRLH